MFNGSYFNNYSQFLSSKGGRASIKEVLPAYTFIIAAGIIYIYMEKLPLDSIMLVFAFIVGLPFIAMIFGFIGVSSRAFRSSSKQILIENNKIQISSLDGKKVWNYHEMLVRYFDGSYIDFIDKNNVLNGHALFSDKETLENIIIHIQRCGFSVTRVPEIK